MRKFLLSIVAVFCMFCSCNRIIVSNGSKGDASYCNALVEVEQGNSLYANCQFSEAMDAYIRALKSIDTLPYGSKTDSLYGVVYQYISDVFSDCEMYVPAKETCFHALNFSIKAEDSVNIAVCYRKAGNLCYYLDEVENPDTLLYYLQKSLPYAKGEDPLYSALYMAVVGVYKDQSDISRFMPTRGDGITLLPEGFNERLPYLNNYIAWCLWVMGRTQEAISYAERTISSSNMKQQFDAYSLLNKMFLEVGDTASAIASLKQLDSINQLFVEAKRKAAGIEKAYGLYETEKAVCQKSTSRKKIVVSIAWIIPIAILLLLAIICMIQRKRKKSKTSAYSFSKRWEAFEAEEMCRRIVEKCASEPDITATNVSSSMICLTINEWSTLKKTFDHYFNGFMKKMKETYPDLNEGELQYILLSVFELSEVQKAALLGLSYQGCISRRNRIQNKTNMNNIHEELNIILKNITET